MNGKCQKGVDKLINATAHTASVCPSGYSPTSWNCFKQSCYRSGWRTRCHTLYASKISKTTYTCSQGTLTSDNKCRVNTLQEFTPKCPRGSFNPMLKKCVTNRH